MTYILKEPSENDNSSAHIEPYYFGLIWIDRIFRIFL